MRPSKHAERRIKGREILFSESRLREGLEIARRKGLRAVAFEFEGQVAVVNVDKATVITAMHLDGMKERVITNIDGVIFL